MDPYGPISKTVSNWFATKTTRRSPSLTLSSKMIERNGHRFLRGKPVQNNLYSCFSRAPSANKKKNMQHGISSGKNIFIYKAQVQKNTFPNIHSNDTRIHLGLSVIPKKVVTGDHHPKYIQAGTNKPETTLMIHLSLRAFVIRFYNACGSC